MSNLQKPGETPKKPGTYTEVGPKGGQVTNPVTIISKPDADHLPPTPERNHRWERIPTKQTKK